jgi:NADPH2:quinone reductase
MTEMTERMKAIQIEKAGGPESLRLVEVDKPRPDQGDVLVRLEASGVNFTDILCRTASHPGMTPPPLILGSEGAGVIEEVGPQVTRFQEGDRVSVYSPSGGTYAEWVSVPENYALRLPNFMGLEDGAAFAHVFLTAYHVLHTMGHAREGEWVVVTAAAGGVGTALVQLARARKLRVIAGTGSPEKHEVLKELGVEYRVDYQSTGLADFVRKTTEDGGADLVLESVGGAVFKEALSCLAPFGRLVLFGISSGNSSSVGAYDLLKTSSTLATFNLTVLFAHRHDLITHSWEDLSRLYQAGLARPIISKRLPLHEAAEAHRLIESRATTGKLLLIPGGVES